MTLVIWSGLDQFISSTVRDPTFGRAGFSFASWVETLPSMLSIAEVSVAIFWPNEAHRNRLYVHVLDDSYKPIGFAKISLDEQNDGRLATEAQLLGTMSREHYDGIHIPRVIDYQPATLGTHAVLLLEPIPADARPLEPIVSEFPATFVKSLAGTPRSLGVEGVQALSWWPAYLDRTSEINQAFSAELFEVQARTALVARSHGDLTIANLVRDTNHDVWVYDWEASRLDAPVLADEISFFLSIQWPRTEADYKTLIARFRDRFLTPGDLGCRIDTMLALAFRSTVNPHDADLIISRWEQL